MNFADAGLLATLSHVRPLFAFHFPALPFTISLSIPMSYQVIARKWRPQTFDEVTGQEIITRTLRNAIEHDRLHHAYLFSGARGVGKTTTARILAKSLNCHKTDGPNLTPCLLTDPNVCASCLEISESRSMDVLEIDAASHTGIDAVRETIIESINFNPARDRYKVFIIDEIHQLSKPAFNALLKTLEEPPGNVVFIMATTELHKVPDTILSRCQEFQFRTIPLQKIFDRLKLIANAEKIDITDDALREIARSGEGSMRDAQSNFDQVISFSGAAITAVEVANALGLAGVEILTKALNAISERQPGEALIVVDDLIARGLDLRNFCHDLLGIFRDLLVFKVAEGEEHFFEGAAFSRDDMRAMAAPFTEADLVRFFNSLCVTEASLREAVHPRYVLEIGLVKLIEMRTVTSMERIIERLDALTAGRPLPEITTAERSPQSAVSSLVAEKKTLKIEPALPGPEIKGPAANEPPNISPFDDTFEEPPEFDSHYDTSAAYEPPVVGNTTPAPDMPHFEPPPVRLPVLTSDDLSHHDDPRLDDAYEERLLLTGDDLLPIGGADTLIKMLFSEAVDSISTGRSAEPVAISGAAAKPAFDVAQFKAEIAPAQLDISLPELGENPGPELLEEYARAHPAVRSVMRVFRAKVVEVSAD
jgi:DNA polymerase III subunit gamma/tau